MPNNYTVQSKKIGYCTCHTVCLWRTLRVCKSTVCVVGKVHTLLRFITIMRVYQVFQTTGTWLEGYNFYEYLSDQMSWFSLLVRMKARYEAIKCTCIGFWNFSKIQGYEYSLDFAKFMKVGLILFKDAEFILWLSGYLFKTSRVLWEDDNGDTV